MTTKINIQLQEALVKKLQERSAELKTDTDTLINKVLEDYFFIDKVNLIRKELAGVASRAGYENEDDILDNIS